MKSSQYVSRAGEKLAFALKEFHIDVSHKICADFGSSTGGFVDCLLQNGAAKVYAVETGYGVLDWSLRNDPSVKVMERTNAMHIKLPEKVDILTNDTSWTRQKFILPNALENLTPSGILITLIKPHYEADQKLLRKGVLDEKTAEEVSTQTVKEIQELLDLSLLGLVKSPILGGKGGNTEYLAYFVKKN